MTLKILICIPCVQRTLCMDCQLNSRLNVTQELVAGTFSLTAP